MERTEKIERLQEIKDEFLELISETEELLSGEGCIEERAEAYWLAHLKMALTREHGYLGGSMVTMEDTIGELS